MTDETLFAAALEKPTAAERQALLDDACGGDVRMRRRIERLLAAHARDRGILDQDAEAVLAFGEGQILDPAEIAEGPGNSIGPYKLKELIGEGGFGLVFVAEQQQPIR